MTFRSTVSQIAQIMECLDPLAYDRVYGAFFVRGKGIIPTMGKEVVRRSADRYLLGAIRDVNMMYSDVLVVGAGPVGLTMAAELARYGIRTRVIDKSAQRTDKSKALVVWSRTLELMDRMGCSGAFVDAGLKVTAGNVIAGSRQISHLRLDVMETPHPYALMLPQSETERLRGATFEQGAACSFRATSRDGAIRGRPRQCGGHAQARRWSRRRAERRMADWL